jgi:hypothetical protein
MRGLLRTIPPYKWLLVLPQLTSRICHPQQVNYQQHDVMLWCCECWCIVMRLEQQCLSAKTLRSGQP